MFDEYYQPKSLAEAARWLSDAPGRRALGGGTSVLPALKRSPAVSGGRWADLTGLKELKAWGVRADGALRLGAGLTFSELSRLNPPGWENNPLIEAAGLTTGPQIRNQATLGGNLLAVGNTDLGGPLLALKAGLELFGPKGVREIPFGDFIERLPPRPNCPDYGCGGFKNEKCPPLKGCLPFSGDRPKQAPVWIESGAALEAGEFISALLLPANGLRWAYQRYAAREALDFPLASVCLGLAAGPDGRLTELRLGLVGPEGRPRLAEKTMTAAFASGLGDGGAIESALRAELNQWPCRRPCQEFRHHIMATLAGCALKRIGGQVKS